MRLDEQFIKTSIKQHILATIRNEMKVGAATLRDYIKKRIYTYIKWKVLNQMYHRVFNSSFK